jgi:hypothetical protein
LKTDERLRRYAELAVRVGANVAEGQYVMLDGLVEHVPLVRALADAAYAAGASFVDVRYADLHIRRSMIEKGPETALRYTPEWMVQRLELLGAKNGAQIIIVGNPEPELFSDLDQDRLGRAQQVAFDKAHLDNVGARAVSWTIVAYQRRAFRRDPFRRSRHGLDRRPTPHVTLALRRRTDVLRAAARGEPADRGSLHDSRPHTRRGRRARHDRSRAPRHARARS